MNDKEKDGVIALAQEVSKYAFAIAFYSSYLNSKAELNHCLQNLEHSTKELKKSVLPLTVNKDSGWMPCCICQEILVDVDNGFDTCTSCTKRT